MKKYPPLSLAIELKDGRRHEISFQGLETGEGITAKIQEFKNGTLSGVELHQ